MVHYIRFLSVPRFTAADHGASRKIHAVFTVTTDLGEAYFPDDLELIVRLVKSEQPADVVDLWPVMWRKNSRVFKLNVRHMASNPTVLMRIHISTRKTDQSHAKGGRFPKVLDAWTSSFLFDLCAPAEDLVERRMQLASNNIVKIWEETGESIAKHIWDGAIGCLEFYKHLIRPGETDRTMPLLHRLLMEQMNISVVELGSGCGIAGIGLAQIVPGAKVMLTDLQEAQQIITRNINNAALAVGSCLTQEVLDWDEPLSSSERHKNVDLLIVCECIYNADSDPALISILQQFITYSPKVKILVVTKRRHFSETVFFDLMEQATIPILEQCSIPLPHHVSDADSEIPQAEIYLYGAKKSTKDEAST